MKTFYKFQSKLIFMVVFTLLFQVVGPVIATDYSYGEEVKELELGFIIKNINLEKQGSEFAPASLEREEIFNAFIDWEFDLESHREGEVYSYKGEFYLENPLESQDLVADETNVIIGEYDVSTEGEITVRINESLYEEYKNQIKEETEEVEIPEDPEEVEIPEEAEEVEIPEETEEVETPEETEEVEIPEEPEEIEKNEVEIENQILTKYSGSIKITDVKVAAEGSGEEITENIIDSIRLLYEDGTEFEDEDLIDVNEDLRFELDWSLPNDHSYGDGDYFEFKLPKQLKVVSPLNGTLGDYGSYTVDTDGNVRFKFNERIEKESNIQGTFWFKTELDEEEITSTEEVIEIIYDGEVIDKITVKIKPMGGHAISKGGQPVGGNFNTEEAQWTVIINTTRDSLINAIVYDPILTGQKLILDSLELKEVEVDVRGEVIAELGEIEDFVNNSTEEELNIELGDTNKAYKLRFRTKLLEDDFKEGTTTYENTAYLKSDGIDEDSQAGGSISVRRPEFLTKTSSNFDMENRWIEWTVNANFTEQSLKIEDIITDEFTFTVGGEELEDVFEIRPENISIVQVDEFDDAGRVIETSDAKDIFDITVENNKVTYTLKEDTNKAFIIKYKTELKEGAYIHEDGVINNKFNLKGRTKTSTGQVKQQVGKKTNAGIDYKNKTINWTITINADKQNLSNFVLRDDFSGSGQELVENSIEITPEASGASIAINEDLQGFEIDFGDITNKYTITYQTKFTYDFGGEEKKPSFKNSATISYETEEGSYELEIGSNPKPNDKTKNNGVKNGKANNQTKEITWTIDINYNELELTDARVEDTIPDNQKFIEGSLRIYETEIDSGGDIRVDKNTIEEFLMRVTLLKDVTEDFEIETSENQVNVIFGEISKSYRIEFMTEDKDGIYNRGEVYENLAKFIPREGEEHRLPANVTLPNQGAFLGKTGTHNKEDWTIDWKIDVNKSLSIMENVKVTDNLGEGQVLLEDSIEVKKAGSSTPLTEGEDYDLAVENNKLEIEIHGKITEAYVITYSSYILVEKTTNIQNDAMIELGEEYVGTVDKKEIVQVVINTSGGTGQGETGTLIIEKTEKDSNRALAGVAFTLVKTIGNQEIIIRQGTTNEEGKLEWKGLKYGEYILREDIPQGYLGEEERTINVSSEAPDRITLLEIENTRKTGRARIIKVDSVTGELLEDAKFTIKNQVTGQEYTFTTDEFGVILEEVPFGEYTIKEIKAPKGYRITKNIPNINVEIDKTATIEVENIAVVEIAGEKTWFVDPGKALPESITVELFADGKKIDEKIVNQGNNWKYRFKDLDKYNRADREINYEINEIELDGYISEKDAYNLTNIQKTSISGNKAWKDDNNPQRPKSIRVHLYANGIKLAGKNVDLTESTDWTFEFEDLPKYDLQGEEITYTIKEDEVEGYETNIQGFNITNTRESKIDIIGEKSWKDVDPTDRPTEIRVNLRRQVKGQADENFLMTKTVKANSQGKWIYEFENLDEFDENGVAYDYIVQEEDVPANYRSIVNGHDITNLRIGETEVAGTKRWKDDRVEDRPEWITVNLLRNNVVIDSKDISATENWTYKFTGLDKYDEDGKYYVYTVKEDQVPGYAPKVNGYDITNTRSEKTNFEITKGWLDGESEDRPEKIIVYVYQNDELFDTVELKAVDNWTYEFNDLEAYDEDGQPYIYTVKEKAIDGYKTTIDGFNITNLRVGKTELEGKKIWKDNDNIEGERPDSIVVKLLQNGRVLYSKEVTSKDNWEYSFKDLDKYDENGIEWGYTVDELPLDGYSKAVEGNNLINTRTGTTELEGKKIWRDNDNIDGDRPDEITVNLLQNGRIFAVETVTAEDNWEYSFKHLPKYDENGLEWGYTVDEEYVEGYSKSVEGNNLINTRTGTTELEGKKIWRDNDNIDGDRPDEITVNLLQNGRIFAVEIVTAEDNWEYSFKHLPKYDENGKKFEYSVTEHDVPGYDSDINEFEITNTRSEEKSININKIWLDDNSKDRPDSIKVELFRLVSNDEKEAVKTYTIRAEDNWTLEIKALPAFDPLGRAYTYVIEEEKLEGYESKVSGFDITNLRSAKTEITGTKIWTGGPSKKPTIELQLYRNGIELGQAVELKDGEVEYTWTDLDKYDNKGVEYKYTVDEVETPSRYRKSISSDGLTITNRYVPPVFPPIDPGYPEPEDPEDPETPDPTEPEDPKDPEDPDRPDPTDPEDPEDPDTPEPTDPESPDPGEEDEDDPTIDIDGDTPSGGTDVDDPTIDIDGDTPTGGTDVDKPSLPKTGEVDNIFFYLTGLVLIVLGFVYRRKTA